MVLILFNGRPIELNIIGEKLDAILEVWFPGTTGAKELSESKGEGMDENKPEQQKDSPQIKDENTQP